MLKIEPWKKVKNRYYTIFTGDSGAVEIMREGLNQYYVFNYVNAIYTGKYLQTADGLKEKFSLTDKQIADIDLSTLQHDANMLTEKYQITELYQISATDPKNYAVDSYFALDPAGAVVVYNWHILDFYHPHIKTAAALEKHLIKCIKDGFIVKRIK